MPLWTIYHAPGIFSDAQKQQLAQRITDHYEQVGLPRFYVVTIFNEVRPTNLYVGGEQTAAGVRIVIDHIARHNPDKAGRQRTARWINEILRPHLQMHAELHTEFHVDETSEELWMINGLVPPPAHSHAERAWAEANKAAPY
jgi:phenylpyruvate tautomerase PptA (4-oxalocrotonate tautomerase family)